VPRVDHLHNACGLHISGQPHSAAGALERPGEHRHARTRHGFPAHGGLDPVPKGMPARQPSGACIHHLPHLLRHQAHSQVGAQAARRLQDGLQLHTPTAVLQRELGPSIQGAEEAPVSGECGSQHCSRFGTHPLHPGLGHRALSEPGSGQEIPRDDCPQ